MKKLFSVGSGNEMLTILQLGEGSNAKTILEIMGMKMIFVKNRWIIFSENFI